MNNNNKKKNRKRTKEEMKNMEDQEKHLFKYNLIRE